MEERPYPAMIKKKTPQNRKLGNKPFCWIEKNSLRKIKGEVESKQLPHLRSVYLAIAEIASNRSSEYFETFIAEISYYSGVSTKTVSKHLKTLKELNLVIFSKQKRLKDGKYQPMPIRLLSVGNFEKESSDIRISNKKSLDFLISDKGKKEIKKELGEIENIDEEIKKMTDWQRAKGIECVDYSAAFRNWIRRGEEYEKKDIPWYQINLEDSLLTKYAKLYFTPGEDRYYYKDTLEDELERKNMDIDPETFLVKFKKENERQ